MPIPKNGSKNPVLGFVKCPTPECNEIATVHQPKGNRKHLRYFICPECGTNQQTGQVIQKYIRANMRETPDEITVETRAAQGSEAEPVKAEFTPETEVAAEPKAAETAPSKAESEPDETETQPQSTATEKPIRVRWGVVGIFSVVGILLGVTR